MLSFHRIVIGRIESESLQYIRVDDAVLVFLISCGQLLSIFFQHIVVFIFQHDVDDNKVIKKFIYY